LVMRFMVCTSWLVDACRLKACYLQEAVAKVTKR
jgi:hypothetical protein